MNRDVYTQKIKELKQEFGITLKELCKRVDISAPYFHVIRKGTQRLNAEVASRLHLESNGKLDVAETCPDFFNVTLPKLGYYKKEEPKTEVSEDAKTEDTK